MSKTWKESLLKHANNLEQQANAARVLALAENPLDGIAVAWDLAAATVHAKKRRRARTAGQKAPRAPVPVSMLLQDLADAMRDKISTVAGLLSPSERERLTTIGPRVLDSIDAQEPDVIEALARLLELSPEATALWLQLHLRQIETRFAS